MTIPANEPLTYLQSLEVPDLCFITMPLLAVDPRYRLNVSKEDLNLLGLRPASQPRIGEDTLCLTVLSMREEGPTANLLAPIVVNLRNRRAVQAISPEGEIYEDFCLVARPGALHVLSAPSPAATASLAIGAEIVNMIEKAA